MSAWETVPVRDPQWSDWSAVEREEWLVDVFEHVRELTWRRHPVPCLWLLPGVHVVGSEVVVVLVDADEVLRVLVDAEEVLRLLRRRLPSRRRRLVFDEMWALPPGVQKPIRNDSEGADRG